MRTHEFAGLDVELYLTENPMVGRGLTAEGVRWAFTTRHASNWHPLTWLSHMIDAQLFGLAAGKHLLVNAVLHTAVALLLLFVLCSMTGAPWPSSFLAGVFALHPLHVESVAWIVERKDVLSALFWTAAIGAYVGHVRRPRRWGMPTVTLLLALGLMAKPAVVTLPFVLLLLDWWPLGRFHAGGDAGIRPWSRLGSLLVEKVPLLLCSVASVLVTLWAQEQAFFSVPLVARASNALVSYLTYLEKAFWPLGLAAHYPHPWSTGAGSSHGKTWIALLLLVAITAWALRLARSAPFVGVGWLWFLGTLLPMIGLVQVGGQAMADRYTYVPLVGISLAVAWTGHIAARRRRSLARTILIPALAVLASFATVARTQISTWRSNETLFSHALAVTSRNWMAHDMLGRALLLRGRSVESIAHFEEALGIAPNLPALRSRLGVAYWSRGRLGDAGAQFRESLRLDPSFVPARYNLGLLAGDLRDWGLAREQYRVLKTLGAPEADRLLLRIPPAERRP